MTTNDKKRVRKGYRWMAAALGLSLAIPVGLAGAASASPPATGQTICFTEPVPDGVTIYCFYLGDLQPAPPPDPAPGGGGGENPYDGGDVAERIQARLLTLRTKKLAKVVATHPPLGSCSQATLEIVVNRLEAGRALEWAAAVLPVIDWITSDPLENAVTGIDLEAVSDALWAIPTIVSSRIQQDIGFLSVGACGQPGQLTPAERTWWGQVSSAFN